MFGLDSLRICRYFQLNLLVPDGTIEKKRTKIQLCFRVSNIFFFHIDVYDIFPAINVNVCEKETLTYSFFFHFFFVLLIKKLKEIKYNIK